jgi:hypothetical protein
MKHIPINQVFMGQVIIHICFMVKIQQFGTKANWNGKTSPAQSNVGFSFSPKP